VTTSSAINEFSFSLPLDNGLLIADIENGLPIDSVEVLSLASQAQSLFISTTLESRLLGSVDKCHQLWSEAAGLFSELCDSWAGIESCVDRCELFSITEEDRSEYAERRSGLPDEGHDPQLEPSAEFSRVEVASIERAYRRL
jgi:hypothetical protein